MSLATVGDAERIPILNSTGLRTGSPACPQHLNTDDRLA